QRRSHLSAREPFSKPPNSDRAGLFYVSHHLHDVWGHQRQDRRLATCLYLLSRTDPRKNFTPHSFSEPRVFALPRRSALVRGAASAPDDPRPTHHQQPF